MTVNKKHDPNTLDLFTNASFDTAHGGDGETDHSGFPESPESANVETLPLPALADVDLSVPEPFRVPGLKSEVLAVPVFDVKLVRRRDHLTRQIQSPADAARLCSELLEGLDREVVLYIALSTSNRVIGAHKAHQGTLDASVCAPRDALKFCLLCNARSFLMAHNHPSGSLEPSSVDVQISKQMKAAADVVGLRLLDSLVIGFDGAYTSLAERGLLSS